MRTYCRREVMMNRSHDAKSHLVLSLGATLLALSGTIELDSGGRPVLPAAIQELVKVPTLPGTVGALGGDLNVNCSCPPAL